MTIEQMLTKLRKQRDEIDSVIKNLERAVAYTSEPIEKMKKPYNRKKPFVMTPKRIAHLEHMRATKNSKKNTALTSLEKKLDDKAI